jgi:hypothetical protein
MGDSDKSGGEAHVDSTDFRKNGQAWTKPIKRRALLESVP